MKDLKFERPFAVEEISNDNKSGKFLFKPLERGYGDTLGNALRRVLLSSLPGAAIVNVKIDNVSHEFTALDGVYEDVMGIILNLKKIVFQVDSQDPHYKQELELSAVGPGVIRAKDFILPEGIEVINPEQVICTLSETGVIRMFATVKRGIGYVSADENKVHSRNTINVIAIDSIFTPVERVIYQVEKARNDMDELTIEIDTNGAIEAKEALALAAKMLVNYFNVLVEISQTAVASNFIRVNDEQPMIAKGDVKLEELQLSVRLFNALKRVGIHTVGELLQRSRETVMRYKSLGKKSFQELEKILAEKGYTLTPSNGDEVFDDIEDFEEEE
jgi:DNA-directed RNA polymerase subunit alpha